MLKAWLWMLPAAALGVLLGLSWINFRLKGDIYLVIVAFLASLVSENFGQTLAKVSACCHMRIGLSLMGERLLSWS